MSSNEASPPFDGGYLRQVADGPFTGWWQWRPEDPFEGLAGPFSVKRDETGRILCGFMPEAKSLNGHGMVHGGCLMTFADFALFMIAAEDGEVVHGVTVTMSSEFVSGAPAGTPLLAQGEIVRKGGGLIFARGMITCEGRNVLAFSGTIKRVKTKFVSH
ncbi:PaaI family thioesterase [Novosphingobium sp. KCTC 2891]|uniref:PaaI family thioesterase n=1 Tax=Novosphingobium sp. KCTC 2891 TaxID=2989730 RepID=UPI00222200D8|nr:PaaI family thioesterase [Novosphingobium sp. KCTC 2891]MCW1383414.1 PaaI family thioesterase [Novosphingobium sp. KCTC 2891]